MVEHCSNDRVFRDHDFMGEKCWNFRPLEKGGDVAYHHFPILSCFFIFFAQKNEFFGLELSF